MGDKVMFARSQSGKIIYFCFGHFDGENYGQTFIVCADRNKLWKKKSHMLIVEVDKSLKDMYFSSDEKNRVLADTVLEAEFKKQPKRVMNRMTGQIEFI